MLKWIMEGALNKHTVCECYKWHTDDGIHRLNAFTSNTVISWCFSCRQSFDYVQYVLFRGSLKSESVKSYVTYMVVYGC